MSEIFTEQLTAAANAVLAVFAIVTAVLAGLAFLKQSREVRAVERQVADGQETGRQQAQLLKVQAAQLEVMRGQLEDQRRAAARQAEVLELQASELRESLEERKRDTEARRRGQASFVFIVQLVGEAAVLATVSNTSNQPIYDAELLWRGGCAGWGEPNPELLEVIMPGSKRERRREFPPGTNMEVSGAVLRFTDAAGVRWVRRADGYLSEEQ